ncbi:hypothetical protein FRC11_001867 [Ceratobasidium sp. 423]|nr:hypothetical protein FRC11_001867 [Ceratobasidium sp. 423]
MKLLMSLCFNSMETSLVFPHQVSQLLGSPKKLGILGDIVVDGARIVNGYIKGLKLELGEELGEEDDQIRDAIINFLLINMTTTAPSPNFAHLLLGFNVSLSMSGAMPIQDSHTIGADENCLGVMLDMVGKGIPHLDRKKKQQQECQDSLFEHHLVFAEKCVKQDPQASRILSLLFQKPTSAKNALTIFEEVMNIPVPGQGLMYILELLESLAFQWTDAKSIEPIKLKLFADLNFDSCLRPDLTGCYLVNVNALVTLLMQQK